MIQKTFLCNCVLCKKSLPTVQAKERRTSKEHHHHTQKRQKNKQIYT